MNFSNGKHFLLLVIFFLVLGLVFVNAVTDYETSWGHPKECGSVSYDNMLPGDCSSVNVHSFGGNCTSQNVRTYCDFLNGDRHVLCSQPDTSCNYLNVTLTCPQITVNNLKWKWGFYEAQRFNNDQQMISLIKKYYPGVWYMEGEQNPKVVDYKAIRRTGTIIIAIVGQVSSRADLIEKAKILQNKYVDGIVFNMEPGSFYGDGYDALYYFNLYAHNAGKLFIVTNAPWETSYAGSIRDYADAILPWMYYKYNSEMGAQWNTWKGLYTRGPVFVMGGIGFVGSYNMNPADAATTPSYMKNTLGVEQYAIFAGKSFYTCSQGGACPNDMGVDTTIDPNYASSYRALLQNLSDQYGSTGVKCTESTSRACTSADWSSIVLRAPTADRNGVTYWKRLSECYGGVEHLIEESTSPLCTEQNWTHSDSNCQSDGNLTRNWVKVGNCADGSIHPSTEKVSCTYQPPTCTGFTYSPWDPLACPQSGVQSRTILSSIPAGCVGGTPEELARGCTFIPTCTGAYWDFNLEPEICPSNGQQIKMYFKISACEGGVIKTDENISCAYNAPVCDYNYSEYGECINGFQTRTAIQTSEGCQGSPDALTKACPIVPTCTALHWKFVLGDCVNGVSLMDWNKISDCNSGLQYVDKNIPCIDAQLPLKICDLNDWSYIIDPIICPAEGKQIRYWTKINSYCQYGADMPAQEIIGCTPADNNEINQGIKCINNENCASSENCVDKKCTLLICGKNQIIENHSCVLPKIEVSIEELTSSEYVDEIVTVGDLEANALLVQAKLSLSENQKSKAIAEVYAALLRTRISQDPFDVGTQTSYEKVLQALNEEEYENAARLAVIAINKISGASSQNSDFLYMGAGILFLLAIAAFLILRKKNKSSEENY